MLITVKIEDQWTLLPIGWYPEEIRNKTELWVSVRIGYFRDNIQDDLNNVIDYQLISKEINALKEQTFKLIETAAEHLITQLSAEFTQTFNLQYIEVEFKKPNIANRQTNGKFHGIILKKSFSSDTNS